MQPTQWITRDSLINEILFSSQERPKCGNKTTKNKTYPFFALIVSSLVFIVILSSYRVKLSLNEEREVTEKQY